MFLRSSFSSIVFAALGLLLFADLAPAALTGATGCLEAKHKAVGRHGACVLKGRLAELAKGTPFDAASCDADLEAAFTAAEATFAPACRTSGDSALLSSRNLDLSSALDAVLDPGSASAGAEASCVQAKLKSAAKRAACGAKAKSTALKKDLLDRDVTKCDAKLVAAFAKIEAAGGCPAGGSAEDVRAAVEGAFAEAEADLADLGTAEYAKKGRYLVATRTMTFVDATRPTKANGAYAGAPDRTIPVTVWYPAVSTAANAAFADAAAPLPLVVRAHGFGAFRNDSADLAKHLASRGMIVVSPDFPLSNINAPGGATLSDLDQQVVDVSFVIDRMLALGATPGDPFEGRVDASRVAAIGHSLGGATVLGTGYHPTLHDARLKAVIALAPLACLYQEAFFDGGDAPLMILSGTADLVTIPASNHVAPFGFANPEKYLVSLDGGLHIGFADDFVRDDSVNADEVLACPALLPPGTPRPVSIPFALPPDFLGGAAAGVDVTGSACEPICPLPTGTWMAHARQRDLELASCAAMLAKVFQGDVSADRLLTGRLDTDNDDVTLAFER